ncbi:MAG: GAF domain-containing protein [Anaerolineales bacterium]|nr:GAF domain-containing protein [Anaerolineales bacterium]
MHQALTVILHAAMQLESIDCGGIYLVDNTGSLQLAVKSGLSPEFVAEFSHFSANSNLAKLLQGRHIHYRDRASIASQPNPAYEREGIQALVVVPVIHQHRTLAVINLASHTHDAIPEHTRTTLEALAAQSGSALVRLRSDAALRASEELFCPRSFKSLVVTPVGVFHGRGKDGRCHPPNGHGTVGWQGWKTAPPPPRGPPPPPEGGGVVCRSLRCWATIGSRRSIPTTVTRWHNAGWR